LHLPHVTAADKAVRAMIEIVAVEFIDTHADRAGCDKRVEDEFVGIEKACRARDGLVGEIAADHA